MWDSTYFETIGEMDDFLNENRNHITDVNITYNSNMNWYVVFYFDTDLIKED